MKNWKLSEKLEILGIALFIISLFAGAFAFVSWIYEEILIAKVAWAAAFLNIVASMVVSYGLVDQALEEEAEE